MATLPQDALFELCAGLLRVENVNDFFNVAGAWVPELFQVRHHNLIIANPTAGLYLRHFSPGFPTEIFRDYSDESARSDLMLQQAFAMEAGEVMHLHELTRVAEPPEGWQRLDRTFRKRSGFIDSIAVLLHHDLAAGWGAGLVLYRSDGERIFDEGEVRLAKRLGPLLATGFQRAWSSALLTAERGTLTDIFFNFGNLTLHVSAEAVPVLRDPASERMLRVLYADHAESPRLPPPLEACLRDLIGLLRANPRMSMVVGEAASPMGALRLYVTPQRGLSGQEDVFLAVVMCDPGFADLSRLIEAGLSDRQVEILALLQRGLNQPDIARNQGISINTVKYHLREIGEKLGATGRSEILSRAITRGIELAVEHGLAGRRLHLGRRSEDD